MKVKRVAAAGHIGAIAAVALFATACGSAGTSAQRRATVTINVASPGQAVRAAAPVQSLPPGAGPLVADVLNKTALRAAPDGRVLARLGTHDQYGSPESLAVVSAGPYWLGVLSPFAGNGRVGWIPRSATVLYRTPYSLAASLSARLLTVRYEGRVVQRYTVGIGASQSPTPTGLFAVTDRLTTGDPGGPYGCCLLALSATAPHAIPGWKGGDRIAIHATPDTESIGQPDSHGCLHVTQEQAHWLVFHVPLGTRIRITG